MKPARWIVMFPIILMMMSCGVSITPGKTVPAPTQTAADALPTQTATSQPTPTETAQPAQGQPVTIQTNRSVSIYGVTFTQLESLGTGVESNIMPALLDAKNPIPYAHPAYLELKLLSYPVWREDHPASIAVYDAQAYAAQKNPDGDQDINRTKAILDLPNQPLTKAVMPFSDLLFASNIKRINGINVRGIRMLVERGNGLPVMTNGDLAYQFSGMTNDGKFYVVVNLPITAPFLPALLDTQPSEGIIMFPNEDSKTALPEYIAKVTNLLGQAETTDTLSPSITAMDVLIESLKIDSAQVSFAASPTCYAVGFVKDVSVPDGTHVKPGKSFAKTWRLQNLGTCAWKGNYALSFFTGEQMGGASPTVILSGDDTVLPGDTVDVSVEMQAPAKKGSYTGYWVLKNDMGEVLTMADGSSFQLSVDIVVAP